MKKITALKAYSRGWEIFKQNALQHIGIFFLVTIVIMALSAVLMPDTSTMWLKGFDMSPENMAMMQQMRPPFLSMLVLLIVEFLAFMFLFGYTLDVVRNQYKGLGEVFSKYVRGSTFLYMIIFFILFFLAAIAIAVPLVIIFSAFQSAGAVFLGILVTYLLIFYFALRMFFVFYLLLDGYDFADAIRLSWKKTKPYVGEIFLFVLIPILIYIGFLFLLFLSGNPIIFVAGYIVLLIIGTIASPYFFISQTVFYNTAVSDDESTVETPGV